MRRSTRPALLALHSLSKRSNLAGYRAGFVAGDPAVLAELLAVRKNLGLMVPAPVQHAATVALGDDEHVVEQRARYAARRDLLRAALSGPASASTTPRPASTSGPARGEPCDETVGWFADRGILVAPGDFYGPARCPARTDRADRDRRAGRRGGRPPRPLSHRVPVTRSVSSCRSAALPVSSSARASAARAASARPSRRSSSPRTAWNRW